MISPYHPELYTWLRVVKIRLAQVVNFRLTFRAWRLFMITLIARTDPATPCTKLLADHEWRVLFQKVNNNKKLPKKTPAIGEVVIWVARLGGFLARKGDGPPGTITLWRGWKRLSDLTEGWNLAVQFNSCG